MSHYPIDELITRWTREELTVEQVIGQILLLLREQERRLREAVRGGPAPQRLGGGPPREDEQGGR
jgi:hypothetical protein